MVAKNYFMCNNINVRTKRKVVKMKNYQVYVDITVRGAIAVKANSKEEAEEIIKNSSFIPSNINTYSHIKTSVVDVIE